MQRNRKAVIRRLIFETCNSHRAAAGSRTTIQACSSICTKNTSPEQHAFSARPSLKRRHVHFTYWILRKPWQEMWSHLSPLIRSPHLMIEMKSTCTCCLHSCSVLASQLRLFSILSPHGWRPCHRSMHFAVVRSLALPCLRRLCP